MDILESKMLTKCTSKEELVSLLYDELDSASRVSIEDPVSRYATCVPGNSPSFLLPGWMFTNGTEMSLLNWRRRVS